MTSNVNIAVIGLGCVGLPLAVEFGKQRPVLGFDINQARIAELQSGQDHTLEVSPAGFTYASDSNTEWMGVPALQAWIATHQDKIGRI